MTEPTEPTPIPDPLAAMAEARPDSSILGNLTINDFVEQEKAIKFCCSGRSGGDHSDCTPLKYLETTLELAKNYGLSVYTRLPTKKGQEPEPLIVRIVNRLTDRGCIYVHEVEVTDTKECLDYAWEKAVEIGVSTVGVIRSQTDLPQILYENPKKQFWHEPEPGIWQCINESHVRRTLIKAGLNQYPSGCGLSDVEEKIHEIVQHCGFDIATPLAGHHSGLKSNLNGNRVLVTRDFHLLEPAKEDGDFRHIEAIIFKMFSDPALACDPTDDATADEEKAAKRNAPCLHFLRHLQCSYNSLTAGQTTGSLATFICGPTNAGKTLLMLIVTAMLGGRVADCHGYLTGETSFNDELLAKEIWLIDDGVPLGDAWARRRFSGLVKQAIASSYVPCHCKGRAQVTLPLFRRLFVAMNDDDLELLPVFASSLEDKYMLLRAFPFSMPEGCEPLPDPEGRPKFMKLLLSELPYFLRWLLAVDLSSCSDQRFGTRPYKEASLVRDNEESSGLETIYDLLCAALFDVDTDAVQMKTAEILAAFQGGSLLGGRKVNPFPNHIVLGRTLSSLSSSLNYKDLVQKSIRDGYSIWTICRRPVSVDRPHSGEVKRRRSSPRQVPPIQDDTTSK